MRLWERHTGRGERPQCSVLGHSLPVELPYPCLWPVGRDYDDALMLVCCFGCSRHCVQQSRPTCDTDRYGLSQTQAQAEGEECRRALVGDSMGRYVWRDIEVMDKGSVAAAGAYDDMPHAVRHEERCKYVYVLFV